jgi:hypothetical protein
MTATGSAAPASGRSPGQLIEFASLVLAPASLLTAIVYYFGYVREQALFAYFGVDLGSLGFSTADYLVRSAGTIFVLIATLLVAAVIAVAGHHLLIYLVKRAPVQWQQVAWTALGAVAVVLLLVGTTGLARRHDPLLDPLLAPVALAAGAVLLEYGIEAGQTTGALPGPVTAALSGTRILRRVLTVALVLVALFWTTATIAVQRGLDTARAIETSLAVQPQAVIYSRDRLQITGPGVKVSVLDARAAAYRYRYNGLRPLVHAGGYWMLLPVGWKHGAGDTTILLRDTSTGIRIDLAP